MSQVTTTCMDQQEVTFNQDTLFRCALPESVELQITDVPLELRIPPPLVRRLNIELVGRDDNEFLDLNIVEK